MYLVLSDAQPKGVGGMCIGLVWLGFISSKDYNKIHYNYTKVHQLTNKFTIYVLHFFQQVLPTFSFEQILLDCT